MSAMMHVRTRSAPVGTARLSPRTGGAARLLGARAAWRVFWLLMLVGHAPGWLASFQDGGGAALRFDLARCALLTGSQLLFLLKLIDVPWLRLPRNRRAWITVTTAIVLLHGDVTRRLLAADLRTDTPVYPVVAASVAGLLCAVVPRLRRIVETLRPRTIRQRSRALLHMLLASADHTLLQPRYLLLTRACLVNRAPPR